MDRIERPSHWAQLYEGITTVKIGLLEVCIPMVKAFSGNIGGAPLGWPTFPVLQLDCGRVAKDTKFSAMTVITYNEPLDGVGNSGRTKDFIGREPADAGVTALRVVPSQRIRDVGPCSADAFAGIVVGLALAGRRQRLGTYAVHDRAEVAPPALNPSPLNCVLVKGVESSAARTLCPVGQSACLRAMRPGLPGRRMLLCGCAALTSGS